MKTLNKMARRQAHRYSPQQRYKQGYGETVQQRSVHKIGDDV